jgi:hypothetical protein
MERLIYDASCPIDAGQGHSYESGLIYVEESHRIGLVVAGDCIDLGIVEFGKVRNNIPTLAPCNALREAWSLANPQLVPALLFSMTLKSMFPKLDSSTLERAWKALNLDANLGPVTTMGAFSILFLAAASNRTWSRQMFKSHEEVCSSLFVLHKANQDDVFFQPCKIAFKTDAGLTLNDGLDAHALMVITHTLRKQCNYQALLRDHTKCALMAIATAMVVRQCIEKEQYHDVAIPFVVGTEDCCSLYLVTLNNEGIPSIQVVGYPNGGNSQHKDLSPLCTNERRQFFVALAFFLNKFQTLIEDSRWKRSEDDLCQNIGTIKYLPLCFTQGTDNHTENPRTGAMVDAKSKECHAREAAACGGRFNILRSDRDLSFTDEGRIVWKEQNDSPFYFQAQTGSRTVTLKVWKADDVDEASVESEWMYHRMACDALVPVQSLIVPSIMRATSSCGSEYLVIALSTCYSNNVQCDNIDNLVKFCDSLIDAVMKLHYAGILHCDLKTSNLYWYFDSIQLLNFGSAQSIRKAAWAPGSEGFQAPELLQRKACSVKTDAFAVGRIILPMVEEFQNKEGDDYIRYRCGLLRDIAVNLTALNPKERWSLWQAKERMSEAL